MTHASDHHYGLTAAEQWVLEGRREALARLVDPGSTWAQHPRCTCGPDQSGEAPDAVCFDPDVRVPSAPYSARSTRAGLARAAALAGQNATAFADRITAGTMSSSS